MPGFLQFLAKTKYDTEIVCDNYEAPVEIRNEDGKVLVMHDELIEVIHELTNAAIAKGLLPAKEEASAPVREFEPEHPFYPLPVESTPAVVLQDAFIVQSGCSRDAVAYVLSDGLLVLEPISNQCDFIEYAQFGTDDIRAMLALKENPR